MKDGEFKKRIHQEQVDQGDFDYIDFGDIIDEACKEFWECCIGFTNEYQNENQFIRRTYRFNESALAEWALKWLGDPK